MPAKSARERMQKYRQKMSEEAKKEMKKKNSEQQKKSRSKWGEKRRQKESKASTLRKEKLRLKRKGCANSNDAGLLNTPERSFKSKQSYGRAISKAKSALPNSPNKKRAVVTKLAEKFGTPPKATVCAEKVPKDTHKLVIDFYEADHISWQFPGRKDYVTLLRGEEKVRVQKKVLLCTVLEAYQQFKKENPCIEIGKSLFASLRPPHILPVTDKDHNVCCCKYHENFELLCQGLRRYLPDLPNTKALLNMIVCDAENTACHLGECETCANSVASLTSHLFLCSAGDELCTVIQWNDKTRKENITMSLASAQAEFSRQLLTLRKHSFIAKAQLQQKRLLSENLQDNEILIQEDFSENFGLKQQNEIMAAHWDQHGITIFTAVVNTNSGSYSYAIVSDELRHDKFSVLAYNRAILNHLASLGTGFEKVHFFSDGAGGQFKNCFTLSTVANPALIHPNIKEADWSFFATSHGKGSVDGVGGTVKRAVWRRILQQQAIVNTSTGFVNVASAACPNITVLHISSSCTDLIRSELTELWKDNKPQTIPDTRSFHHFKAVDKLVLEASPISPFMPQYVSQPKRVPLFKGKDTAFVQQVDSSSSVDSEEEMEITESGGQDTPTKVKDFLKVLKGRQFRMRGETPGDGNCFFWALESQLTRAALPTFSHSDLRSKVCDYLQQLPQEEKESLSEFVPEQKLSEYISELRKVGTYADHITVEYTSRMLEGQPIRILTESSDIVFGQADSTRPSLYLGYIASMQHYISIEPEHDDPSEPCVSHTHVQKEKYYVVDYVDRFYIGRVLGDAKCSGFYSMKFLHQMSKGGILHFYWPKKDDCDDVFCDTIFYGPIELQGCGEYTIKETDMTNITMKFTSLNH